MTTSKAITFAEFRQFLSRFGYVEKRTENACVFHRDGKDMLIFRHYGEDETVTERDLRTTRVFLDGWGYLDKRDFDAALHEATTSA